MLALDDAALARVVIAATAIAPHARGRWLSSSPQRPRRLVPKRKHLLLVGSVVVRLNESAGPAGQLLSIAPRHVLGPSAATGRRHRAIE